MSRLEFWIAWRYLRSRRGSRLLSFISVIAIGGVIVGVSALIVVMGVMNGLQRDLREKILVGSPDVLAKVKAQPGVVEAAPFVMTQAIVTAFHKYEEGAQIVGIEPDGRDVANVTDMRSHIIPGQGDFRFASRDGRGRGIVLGKFIAERLQVYPGDSVQVISRGSAQVNAATGQIVPTFTTLEVTGIFETGMYEYDNTYAFVSLRTGQELAGLQDAVTGLEVKTPDRWQANEVASALSATLGFPYRTVDWQEQNRSLFQALKLEKLGMGLILLLIVLVASFNIVSNLTMVVADKTREIGILKAMGMRSSAVRRIFFSQGLVIGVVGTLLGVLLGIGVALALGKYKLITLDPSVYFIDHLPVATEVQDVVWIIVASVGIAALATIYPAMQAARLYPVEAIRHE